MYWILIPLSFLVASCGIPAQAYDDTEHVLDDTAVRIQISREAVTADADVTANVQIMKHKG